MRLSTVARSAILCLIVTSPVFAQTTKSSGPEIRYFTSLGDILGDLPVDAFIRETRQDGKVVSALLDVCYSVSLTSDRKDRFAIELKPDGPKLSGSGETLVDKKPVSISLTRKQANKSVAFDGKITIGDKPSLVSSTDNTDSDEKEFQASQTTDDSVSENPKDFTEVSPQSLAAKVKSENFVALLKELRGANVQLSLDSLATDCTSLRSGMHFVRFTVDPARAASLLGQLQKFPGVISAGWTTGSYDIERSIRLPAADWKNGDAIDRTRLATAISGSIAKSLSAQPVATKWNETTGELTVSVKRPNTIVPALNLIDTIEVSMLVGGEKPESFDRLIVWIGSPSTTTSDETAGSHLNFADTSQSDDEGSFADDDSLVRALAADLKAQRWDANQAAWK